MSQMTGRRLRLLRIDADLILDLIRAHDGTGRLTSAGLPDDARVDDFWADDFHPGCLVLALRSETYEPVPNHVAPPDETVTFTRRDRDA